MPEILQPDKSSRENIQLFINSIENEDIRLLIQDNIELVLAIGAGSGNRDEFFRKISKLIDQNVGVKDENQGN